MRFFTPLLVLAAVSACLAIPVSYESASISEYNPWSLLALKKLGLTDQIVHFYIKSK
jgi:hypothetical protein